MSPLTGQIAISHRYDPGMSKPNPIDRAHKLLRLLGWSFGEMCFQGREQLVWQVFARRDADRIIVRAPTQTAAWDEALRQAGIVQRG
jgi:hypothetical protein